MFARNDEAQETYHVAFDCGNSSFRIMLGSFSNGRFSVEVIDQVPNNPLDEGGYLHWDIDAIFTGLKKGLKKAWTTAGRIDTVGVTTWGIDFGLLGADGSLLANPLCYRNTLGVESMAALSPEALAFNWERSGIQNHPMNSPLPAPRNQGSGFPSGSRRPGACSSSLTSSSICSPGRHSPSGR